MRKNRVKLKEKGIFRVYFRYNVRKNRFYHNFFVETEGKRGPVSIFGVKNGEKKAENWRKKDSLAHFGAKTEGKRVSGAF